MNNEAGKKAAAERAVDYVRDGMTLGLGTGSTAKYFVDALGARVKSGWSIQGVPTSEATAKQAREHGIEIITPDETTIIDVAIDGTDEADPALNLIKGGGGALLREKIVASAARKFIVIADKSKRVVNLGAFALPIEIEPFGWALSISALRARLKVLGIADAGITLRSTNGEIVKSDGGHLIVDCALQKITDPAGLDATLTEIPGVIETGLFCGIADAIIYGDEDGVSIEGERA